MVEIALASINSFAPVAQQANVPPEEPIFVLASSQLQEIVAKAVQEALESPKDLRLIVLDQAEEISALNTKLETMQKDMDNLAENQLIQLRLINDLRKKDPGKTEISRSEKIEKYLQARPDHKATFETLKGHLQVNNARLNETIKTLIATSDHTYSIQKDKTGDKRKRVLIMLPR